MLLLATYMQTYTRIINYSAELVVAHMTTLGALVPRSRQWSAFSVQHSRKTLKALSGRPGYNAFRREVIQTLEVELPELFGSGRGQAATQIVSELWKQQTFQQQQGPLFTGRRTATA
jgi:hypothetical protein